MSSAVDRGMNRQGLDEAFAAQEAKKSGLLLEAQILRAEDRGEAAATLLAEAAHIEELLSERCLAAELREKAWLHLVSAAGCWAQVGNFYRAISLCDDLLGQADLSVSLHRRIESYAHQLRARRAQWYADLVLESAGK